MREKGPIRAFIRVKRNRIIGSGEKGKEIDPEQAKQILEYKK